MPNVEFPPRCFLNIPNTLFIDNEIVYWKVATRKSWVKIILADVVKIPGLIIIVNDFAMRQTYVVWILAYMALPVE